MAPTCAVVAGRCLGWYMYCTPYSTWHNHNGGAWNANNPPHITAAHRLPRRKIRGTRTSSSEPSTATPPAPASCLSSSRHVAQGNHRLVPRTPYGETCRIVHLYSQDATCSSRSVLRDPYSHANEDGSTITHVAPSLSIHPLWRGAHWQPDGCRIELTWSGCKVPGNRALGACRVQRPRQ